MGPQRIVCLTEGTTAWPVLGRCVAALALVGRALPGALAVKLLERRMPAA